MLTPRFAASIFCAGMLALVSGAVCGQSYPNKPVRLLTSAVGGTTDFTARLIAQAISGPLGQQVIVENRAGSPAIAGEILAKASPDGYTLLAYGPSILLLPFLQSNVPYDPIRDFSPISLTDTSPTVLVVHPSLPVKSVKDLIALAKARPGELNYGRASVGGANHLPMELFKSMAGVNIVTVPYKGGGPAVIGLLGGEVQLLFGTAASVMAHVKSGRLRALAVTSATPSAAFPGLPTVAASGLPGFESATIDGIFAPAATPAAIINRLNQEIVRALNQPDVKAKFLASGVEAVGSSPEQYAATVKLEMAKWGKLIKDAGIRVE